MSTLRFLYPRVLLSSKVPRARKLVESSILEEICRKIDEQPVSFASLLDSNEENMNAIEKIQSPTLEIEKTTTRNKTVLEHYEDIKRKFPQYFVLYQVGEFYEIYGSDVEEAANIMEIAQCKPSSRRPVPMTGVPLKNADCYIEKLIKAGKSVVLCDQSMEKLLNGQEKFVRRISSIITPGTLTDDNLLDRKQNNFLLSIQMPKFEDQNIGLAWIDVSTGFFAVKSISCLQLESELLKINPKEIIIDEQSFECHSSLKKLLKGMDVAVNFIPTEDMSISYLKTRLEEFIKLELDKKKGYLDQFSVFELASMSALLGYLSRDSSSLTHIELPLRSSDDLSMSIDSNSFKSLEILRNLKSGESRHSLLHIIDCTLTANGARLLQRKLQAPSLDIQFLNRQYDLIDMFRKNYKLTTDLRTILKPCHDLERCIQRLSLNRNSGGPRDMKLIGESLKLFPSIIALLRSIPNLVENHSNHAIITSLTENLESFEPIQKKIESALRDEVPARANEGGLIKEGYCPLLDVLRSDCTDRKLCFDELLKNYRKLTGRPTLKISEKKHLGYYVEISATQKPIDHPEFMLISQIDGKFRYKTKELINLRNKHLENESEIIEKELELYEEIRTELVANISKIRNAAKSIAEIDFLTSMAHLAVKNRLVRPNLSARPVLNIKGCKHLVIESILSDQDKNFASNDCILSENVPFWLITGPNMGGKSTFLRQNALACILAQSGCFVPAEWAEIGIVDSIFSRIGASDDISKDQSTFMTEMAETAFILNNATPNSFVIMDEVGRGTSTEEGLALAASIVEHLVNVNRCRTLFATHYQQLPSYLSHIKGYECYKTSAVEDKDGNITFLHKLQPGIASKSYGIQIAELAGVPKTVTDKANEIFKAMQQK